VYQGSDNGAVKMNSRVQFL